jgi:NAD(P)-dependent dehydrogenase (short-subunit alcohol dehydrogenase family)
MSRFSSLWDVIRTDMFLASDDASYVTGVVIPVDGEVLHS